MAKIMIRRKGALPAGDGAEVAGETVAADVRPATIPIRAPAAPSGLKPPSLTPVPPLPAIPAAQQPAPSAYSSAGTIVPLRPIAVTAAPPPPPPARAIAVAEPVAVPVYPDATDADRMSITQQVIDFPDGPAPAGDDGRDKALFNSLYDAVLIVDMDGGVVDANVRAEQKFGLSREALCETAITAHIAGADERLLQVLAKNLADKKFTVLEASCRRADNGRFPADIVVNRVVGGKEGFFFAIRETARKTPGNQQQFQKLTQTLGEGAPNAQELRKALEAFRNPLQTLSCLIAVEGSPESKAQIQRLLESFGQLMQLADAAGAKAAPVAPPAPAPARTRDLNRILVVDGDAGVGQSLSRSLAALRPGLQVDTVQSGIAAVDQFCRQYHGLVVLDADLPDMSGEETFNMLESLCRKRQWELPPFVFIQAQAVPGLQQVVGDGSLHARLLKPFGAEALLAVARARLKL